MATKTSIPISSDTLEFARSRKRGGETWDALLRKMAEQYDPERVEHAEDADRQ